MGNIVERAYERIHMGKDFDPSFVRELIAYLYMSTGESRRNARRWSAAWKRAAKWERAGHLLALERIKEAKHWCPRLLRERDEARAERDEKEMVNDILETDFVLMNEHIHHLESDRDALAKQVDELRAVIEIPKWGGWNSLPHCPWCLRTGNHAYNCPRQKALGKA